MTANVVTDLTDVQDLLAEKQAWGGPDWTVMGLATAAASVATLAGATASTGQKIQHYLDYLTVSSSAISTAATVIQIKDGSTVIWECQLGIGCPLVNIWDFSGRPLQNTAGNAFVVGTGGTQGNSVVTEVSITGHSNRPFSAA